MEPTTTQPFPVQILAEVATKLNFAAHQSAFSFLRSLRLEASGTAEALDGIEVAMVANPPFLRDKTWRVDALRPGELLTLPDRDVEPDGQLLMDLTDSVKGSVSFTARRDDVTVGRASYDVELLARNEWGGAGFMPELLAAFSLPNDPAIDRILHGASRILAKAGRPDGIDGYKSKSRERTWEIASAIYGAIGELGITYALPPASFERNGQKIRLPGQILTGKVATCLDTAMLFAAALEQAGLNPLVALPEGHALVGVWLQPEELSSVVIDEAETLRKRIQLNELVMIETTLVTSKSRPPFSVAVATGAETILPEKDETFLAAVDIRRARAHRILPLGKSAEMTAAAEETESHSTDSGFEAAPSLPDFDVQDQEKPDSPSGRLERWQRKLLDLSAMNPLLNHRSSKSSLPLVCPDPGFLEDRLSAGSRIALLPASETGSKGQDEEIHRQRTGEGIAKEYARSVLDKGQVLVDLDKEELGVRAVEIYRKAQSALQEGGSNTLFLSLGFLLWKQKEHESRKFRAPLILLPVTLERKTARSGFTLTLHDDEPRINTTLLEMLRKDFGIDIQGLDGALPTDDSGIDVARIWNTVRLAVKDAAGFEVVEDVVLGNFSFAKYLMWKDLVDRVDVLRENPVVRHLIDTPRDPYGTPVPFVQAGEIDRDYAPSDLLAPLPADASQMSAIATADKGKDFVIIGPPGTGKSQTISNLIAHMLGKGKTVLFVSEKTAALEVVHRRLEEIGLGRFCLPLHSNKARKADVLERLRKAWDSADQKNGEAWQEEAQRLRSVRDRLNAVVETLHRPRRNGLTAYAAMGIKIRDERFAARATLAWNDAELHDPADLEALREAVRHLGIQWKERGSQDSNALSLVEEGDWSPAWEAKLAAGSEELSRAALRMERTVVDLLEATNLEIPGRSVQRLSALTELAALLLDSWRKQGAFALGAGGLERIEALEEAVERLKTYARLQSGLSCAYAPFAWKEIDGEQLALRWQTAEARWWPRKVFARKTILKELAAKGAKAIPDPAKDAPLLRDLRIQGEALEKLDRHLSALRAWDGPASDPEAVERLRQHGLRLRAAVGKLADDGDTLLRLQSRLGELIEAGNDLLAPEAVVGKRAQELLEAERLYREALAEFSRLCNPGLPKRLDREETPLVLLARECGQIPARRTELKAWCSWRRARADALALGLAPLIEALEKEHVPPDELLRTFEASYCTWWSAALITQDEVLRTFSAAEHEETIRRFRELDGRFQELTAQHIAARLSGAVPDAQDMSRRSSWGVLRHEIQKKMRHKPIRQLLTEIPDVLGSLVPCLMMSPLSVAQYLPPEQALFDLVIFDEASQITVWDAIGALARGRQVVIAGDPKQMPPTNFFARASGDDPDGDVDTEGDLESILDEMQGASIPTRTLNLHYRSRRESLIAFSNSRYYGNGLITFPAPANPDQGIRLVRHDGFYARGGARHNEGEAKAIVAEIVRRLVKAAPGSRASSIGVVTFNAEQQKLIEDLLDTARAENPRIEWAFSAESAPEPVFVKNLETVQGDERDTILFSVTYGPDQAGHVTMNFGPLNRTGGERRLNVALTRARSEMVVFTSLAPERIELSRTQALAVRDLKHFLEYAERGPAALAGAVHGSRGDFESPFEEAVAEGLRAKGWELHPQVGVSAYRIDLGIVHPDHQGLYLAAVECDGAMYHSGAYARERDKIRQAVLEGLGWSLLRGWSTDWWNNPIRCIDILDQRLHSLLDADRTRRQEQPATASEVSESEAPEEGSHASQPTEASNIYCGADLDGEAFLPEPERFYSADYEERLASMIDHVVQTEAPIHEELLVRRIARHHGFQRTGSQIRSVVTALAGKRYPTTQEEEATFYWSIQAQACTPARSQGRDEEMRNVELICRAELLAIKKALSLENDPADLARALGLSRLTKATRERLGRALG